ncbi:hypothetical protein DFJ43DRAFT_1228288 [Lentinula guzmanii]|uniref:F-box domain-containing protein n=1 Tax=Lentinula guzmanii TaxID=2804957 RepID=A0AA38J9V7_9AGAR|nr:hypothetical protein DFJ43DRAFT_1228288 [Lentinula guzmanii]
MGQYWKIRNIDYEETTGDLGKLGEFFWYGDDDVISLLITPVIPPHFKSKPVLSKTSVSEVKDDSTISPPTLLTLPVELLVVIAEELMDDYLNLICFSLTCVSMWELTHPVRYRVLESELRYKSWAGCRIILLGDYAQNLPKGILTAEEIGQLTMKNEDDKDSDEDEEDLDKKMDKTLGRRLYKADFRRVSLHLNISVLEDRRLWGRSSLYKELSKFDRRFRPWLSFDWNRFLPREAEGDSWMVRNFSKREFVAMSSSHHLAQVVFSLIGCSDDPSISMIDGDWLIEGPWAGNRIDITLASLHEQEHRDETDWKDITAEVKQRLEALAIAESRNFEF